MTAPLLMESDFNTVPLAGTGFLAAHFAEAGFALVRFTEVGFAAEPSEASCREARLHGGLLLGSIRRGRLHGGALCGGRLRSGILH